MRLRDADGTTHVLDVAPGRPMHLLVRTAPDPMRTLGRAVQADALRRAAERHRAVVAVGFDRLEPAPTAADLAALGCRPAEAPDGAPAVVVGGAEPGAVRWLPDDRLAAVDLAARLALLARCDVDAAHQDLERWRDAVAVWAEHPSRPMCADYVGWVDEAVDDGPDLARVVTILRELERHPELPAGSKFETFVHVDRFLAVDLAARVGLSR